MPDSKLIKQIIHLKNTNFKDRVGSKLKQFSKLRFTDNKTIFKELCFCLLTANFNAERSLRIQNALQDGFLTLPEKDLAMRLKELGHRFPNTRAKYIVEARKHIPVLKDVLKTKTDEQEIRNWFVKNVKGLGLKEASHFLRNIGFENFAIVDFHIVDLLVRENFLEKPKSMTQKVYLLVENVLKRIAKQVNLNLAGLDLYLWYIETGKIVK